MAIFDSIKPNKVKRNKFSLSHERKFSMNMGDLVPIMCQEIVPGDSFRVNTETLMRLAPMLAPIMHRVNVYTHYFFVPNRLVWNEWEDFITGGRLGTAQPVMPYFSQELSSSFASFFEKGSLWDYMGLPPVAQKPPTVKIPRVSALPFRAYQLIWSEYYRDQNLDPEPNFDFVSGVITSGIGTHLRLQRRCWEKDYFTSALPFAQRGGEALIPFSADVTYKDISDVKYADGSLPAAVFDTMNDDQLMVGGLDVYGRIENIESIENGTSTINDLRRAIKIQEWLERAARGGSRYIEAILSHFGVRSSDARLQRPEYLGGGKSPVVISEVLSTVGTVEETEFAPQGTMSGHGISIGNRNGFKRSFEEHGYVIGIMSVLPRTSYQDGVPRHFLRQDKFDFFWPEFAHLGEQEVYNKELFYDPTLSTENDETFGYQSRYAEYKYCPSTVHGDMRDTLDFWHMGRKFDIAPSLNTSFVTSDPTHRIFAVEDEDVHKLWVQIYNEVDALRPMPFFGEPSLV